MILLLSFLTTTNSFASSLYCEEVFKTESIRVRIKDKILKTKENVIQKFISINEKYNKNPEWQLSAEDEAHLNSLWDMTDKTDAENLELIYQEITKIRIRNKNAISKQQIISVLKSVNSKSNWYENTIGYLIENGAGPHYNPVFNRTSMGRLKSNSDQHIEKVIKMIQMHEVEHAVHRSFNPLFFLVGLKVRITEMLMLFKTPISPVVVHHMERRAIGSQWELAKRIPRDKIEALLSECKNYEKDMVFKKQEQIFEDIYNNPTAEWFISKYFEILLSITKETIIEPTLSNHLLDMISIFLKNEPKELKNEINLVMKEARNHLTKEEFQVFNFIIKFGAQKTSKNLPHHIVNYKISNEARLEFSDLLRSKIKLMSNRDLLSDSELINLRMNTIFLKSLENHHLTKEEFIQVMLKYHGYDYKSLYSNHYNFTGFLPTMMFYDMISKLTIISRYPNQEVLFMAHDLQFIYQLWFNYLK